MKCMPQLLLTLFVVLILDIIWLMFIADNFFHEYLGFMMRDQVVYSAAILFYVLFSISLVVFVLMPNQSQKLLTVTLLGGFFGLTCYGSFDLTCYAVFRGYPLIVVFVDILWGMFLGAFSSGAVHVILRRYNN